MAVDSLMIAFVNCKYCIFAYAHVLVVTVKLANVLSQ